MERPTASAHTHSDGLFRDGFGPRRLVRDAGGVVRELLCIRAELADVEGFESSLRARVARLATFRHPYCAPICGVERLSEAAYPLGLLSEHFSGVRLPLLFASAARRSLRLDIDAAVFLLRQLFPAIAALHHTQHDIAHGALACERVLFTANGRLMLLEYALAPALEQLRYSRDQFWRQLQVAIPAGTNRIEQRADVLQMGMLALSLISGRTLREEEYPERIGDVVAATWAAVPGGGLEPVPPPLREWLVRALQLDRQHAFATAEDAGRAFVAAADATDYPGRSESVEQFLAAYRAAESASRPMGSSAMTAVVSAARPIAASAPAESAPPAPAPSPVPVPVAAATSPSAPVTLADAPRPSSAAPPSPAETDAADDFDDAFFSEVELDAGVLTREGPRAAPAVAGPSSTGSTAGLSAGAGPVAALPAPAGGLASPAPAIPGPGASNAPPGTALAPAPRQDLVLVESFADFDVLAPVPPADTRLAAGGPAMGADSDPPGFLALPREWQAVVLIIAFLCAAIALVVGQRMLKPAGALPTGRLTVMTNPRGAVATLDGHPIGATPLTVNVPAGMHTLVLQGGGEPRHIPLTIVAGGSVEQYFDLPAGPAATQAETGWLTLRAPFEFEVIEGGQIIGTSASGRLTLPTGLHTISIRNSDLGFLATHQLSVTAGKSTTLAIEVPKGTIAVHAVPPAEVWLDGKRLGQTPIDNLPVAIGTHDLIVRHPELGDHREALTVSLRTAARVDVDLRRP